MSRMTLRDIMVTAVLAARWFQPVRPLGTAMERMHDETSSMGSRYFTGDCVTCDGVGYVEHVDICPTCLGAPRRPGRGTRDAGTPPVTDAPGTAPEWSEGGPPGDMVP
ncbi:hypothetical protein GCM10023085_16110 [Actinomadura viridis]